MADLTTRLNDIEAVVNANHSALMVRLGETNDKLDEVIALLSVAPPVDATLTDVIAAITTQTAIMADVHLDTMSMDAKLFVIRDEIADIHTDTISIDQKLLRIRDAIAPPGEAFPAETRSSILWSLYRLVDAIQPVWPRPVSTPVQPAVSALGAAIATLNGYVGTLNSNVQTIQSTMGVHTGGAEFTLASLVRASNTALVNMYTLLGAIGAPWPADVLAALVCICDAAQSQLPLDPTDPTLEGYCEEPYVSTGMWLGAFSLGVGTDIIVAVWPDPPPDGLTFGTVFGVGTDYTELNSTDWSLWSVFVQSEDDQYADGPWTGGARYPTNQWRQLDGDEPKAFSVSARASIKVYLCGSSPYELEPDQCVTVNDTLTFEGHRAFVIPDGLPDNYTISAMDNWYVYTTEGSYIGGPYMAGTAYGIITFYANFGYMFRFGSGPGDPPVDITICNPSGT